MITETNTLQRSIRNLSNSTVRVLEISTKPETDVKQVFSHLNLDVTHFDPRGHDLTQGLPGQYEGPYDIVYVAYALEYIDRLRIISTFRSIASAVRNHGEVWIIVPSMEWAANEIINRREGIHVQANLFGTQAEEGEYHRTGFTLEGLRSMVELCGMIIRKAYQSPYNILVEGAKLGSLLNVVIAVRVDEMHDPAEAIS